MRAAGLAVWRWSSWAEAAVLLIVITALFGLVVLQVAARLGGHPPVWTEEVSRYLMIWLMFFGAAVCVRTNEHVGFLLLVESAGPRASLILRRAAHAVTFTLMSFIFVLGVGWVGGLVQSGQTSITISMPVYWAGLAVPIAGLLGAAHALRHLFGAAPQGRARERRRADVSRCPRIRLLRSVENQR